MKTAVIVGSFSMILALLGVVGQYVLHFSSKDKGREVVVISAEELKSRGQLTVNRKDTKP